MWTRVITLCCLLLLVISTKADSDSQPDIQPANSDSEDEDEASEYDINNFPDEEITGNKEHLKEHLEHLDEEQLLNMTDEEKEFHFFNSHDYNKDAHLDGLEMLSSLTHVFNAEHILGAPPSEELTKTMSDVEIKKMHEERNEKLLKFMTNIIDNVMRTSDQNNNGYLDYVEYMHARQHQKQQVEKIQKEQMQKKEEP